MKKINLVVYLIVTVVIIAIIIAGVFVYPKVSDTNKTAVNENADVNNLNSVPALVTSSEVPQGVQNYQQEIIENSEKHKNDFKSISTDSNEKIVIITTYSRELFDRTEYALGIKYSDFKNLNINKSDLKNESGDLALDGKNFIQKVILGSRN